jgi:hypothetical protein
VRVCARFCLSLFVFVRDCVCACARLFACMCASLCLSLCMCVRMCVCGCTPQQAEPGH